MAHFAEIDENNIVVRVLVIPDEVEHRGQEYLANELGFGGQWIQTSYNAKIRYNYAGTGFYYDPIEDAFIPPMPECGHDELLLTDKKLWQCDNPEHKIGKPNETNSL